MATTKLDLQEFEKTLQNNEIVLIDFWAPWCAPCRTFGPIFEKVSDDHPDIVFAKVNTEEERELAGGLGIRSIPTLMIFRDNILLFSQPGLVPEEALKDLVEQTKKLDMDEVREKMAAHKAENEEATA